MTLTVNSGRGMGKEVTSSLATLGMRDLSLRLEVGPALPTDRRMDAKSWEKPLWAYSPAALICSGAIKTM